MPYRFFDQTGDIGVSLTASRLPELFAAAAAAFTDTMTAITLVEPRRPEEVDVDAPELDLLLVDFLSGERLDANRHQVKVLVKEVTYRGLHVRRADHLWTANIVLDI